MNDISGLPKGTSPAGPLPDGQAAAGEVSTGPVGAIDTMVYEGTDTISPAVLTLLQFAPKTVYEASIQYPELPAPDPDGQSGPQPYGMAEQKLIKQNISKQVLERLKQSGLPAEAQRELYGAILSGKKIEDPALAKEGKRISDEVSEETRKGAHLPDSWTILSTSPKDWTPEPVQPYDAAMQEEIEGYYHTAFDNALKSYAGKTAPPLTSEQIEKIVTAYASGSVPSDIAEHFEAVSKIATGEVQQKYGLPNTWFRGTDNPEDLKPVNLGVVSPSVVNQARAEFLLDNVEGMMNAISTALQQVLEKLPHDDPNQIVGKEYQTIISQAIRELKAILRDMLIKDADKSKQAQSARGDMTNLRQQALDDEMAKRKEMQEKQEKANKVSFIMKIVGPIIAAVATIVGAALAIFTFGASTALIVAGIAIGVALTAYSIADSVTGCTGKLIQTINTWLETTFPDSEINQKLVKFAIVAAIVAVLVIAVVLTGGGAAASIGTQTAAQIARQAVMEAVKQLSLQLIIMTIMSSNAIPELLGAILKANGVDENTSQIWEIVMMAVTMLIAMIAIAKGGGASGVTKTAEAGAAGAVGTSTAAVTIGSRIAEATRNLINKMKEGAEEAVKALQEMIRELIKQLKQIANLPKALLNSADGLLDAINQGRSVAYIEEALNTFKTALSNLAAEVKTASSAAFEKALNEAIELLRKIPGKTKESLDEFLGGLKQIRDGFKGFRELIGDVRKFNALKNLEKAGPLSVDDLDKLQRLEQNISRLGSAASTSTTKTLQLTSGTIEVADGVMQGILGIQVYKLLKEVGETKLAEDLMQMIIDDLNKLLQKISGGMDANMEALTGLNQFLTNFWASQSETSSKIERVLQI